MSIFNNMPKFKFNNTYETPLPASTWTTVTTTYRPAKVKYSPARPGKRWKK